MSKTNNSTKTPIVSKVLPWRSPYLVQRLKDARFGNNPFSFGGGYRNGGLSSESATEITDLFSFDYMGAAEFEFGAVPKALYQLVSLQSDYELLTFGVTAPLASMVFQRSKDVEYQNVNVYGFCLQKNSKEFENFIRELASPNPPRLKERAQFCIPPADEIHTLSVAWIDLDNATFWTFDETLMLRFLEWVKQPQTLEKLSQSRFGI